MRLRALGDLTPPELRAIRDLLDCAFTGRFSDDDFAHALADGQHVLVYDDADILIAHGCAVPRTLYVDEHPVDSGYVEAVAVDTPYRGRGLGHLVMDRVEQILDAGYVLGALSASAEGRHLYASRGWRSWQGPLGVATPHGWTATPDENGAVFVRQRPGEPPLSLDGTLTCRERSGDDW
ncbi:MAG: GNAT family N-acetyltransferase [Gemmatales bacterium]